MTTLTLTLPRLHPAQWQIAQCGTRFIVLITGRRFGKTLLGVSIAVKRAAQGQRVWWIAPSYKQAAIGWRGVKKLAQQIPGTSLREGDQIVNFPGGGWVQVRTGNDPALLRGEGLDYAILDEAAFMKSEVWTDAIRPALSDRKGGALFISTPAGRNWIWMLYQQGLNPEQSEWRSFRFNTADNPYIEASEIAAARQGLPERVFQQEYMAEFLADAGAVFRGVEAVCTAPLNVDPKDHKDHTLCCGADWGKSQDFTVLTMFCVTCNQMVDWERFNRIDYAFQVKRLHALVNRWGSRVTVIAESNSMGEPVIEQIQRSGLYVRSFATTAQSKPPLIESLALAIERKELTLQNIPVLVGELQAYTMILNKHTGRPAYGAPDGMHDDTVMSLALAWHGRMASGLGISFA